METIIDKIKNQFDLLSPGQKNVAHYIQMNTHDVMVQSAQKIAAKSSVSEATVHRLAQALGYPSFTIMHKDIQQYVLKDQRAITNLIQSTSQKKDSWIEEHFTQEIENLEHTNYMITKEQVQEAAKMFVRADRIWVAGWRMGLSVTAFFSFVLKYMLGNCELIPQGGVAEYTSYIKSGDVVFVCGFPRYCSKTLKVADIAKEKGAIVIVLTDSTLSPFTKLGDLNLFAQVKSTGFLDSYTAPLSVVNAIIQEISNSDKDRVKRNIQNMEVMFKQFEDTFEWMNKIRE